MKTTEGMSLANNARRYTRKTVAGLLSVVFFAVCYPITFAAEDPSVPLTPDELAGMTHEEIAAISQEQSDATLNKMAQLFQDGEKQGLDEYLAALGFATTYEEYEAQKEEEWLEEQASLEPSIQPLWQSDNWGNPSKACHETLTAYGFLMYIGAMQELFGMSGSFGYTLSDMQILSENSAKPDLWDIGIGWDRHFYDPDTGLNLRDTTPTAKDRAEHYYSNAISDGNSHEDALKDLAYALHYVQDVSVPHHAANKPTTLTDEYNHAGFEKLASKILIEEEAAADLEVDYESSFYNARISQGIGDFVHEIAASSKPFIDLASDKNNEGGQRLLLAFLLPSCMYQTSGVLYKFAKDKNMI